MSEITYTLLGDGSSDKALLNVIDWTLQQHFPQLLVQRQWADFSLLRSPPPNGQLDERIRQALSLYPCDWLFIHRDAEAQTVADRRQEVERAWQALGKSVAHQQVICVIPVRMTEAWLLIDDQAIRTAAANPSGRQLLQLPALRSLESLSDPKEKLKQLLREASGLQGRRLQKFNESRAIQLVAQNITDFSPLQSLKAFSMFEESVRQLPVAL